MARIALFDDCVLYPAPLRDLLMWLALTELYQARWAAEVHDEYCLVTGYEPLVPTPVPPDPANRHILAAAIHSGAGGIATFNFDSAEAAERVGYRPGNDRS